MAKYMSGLAGELGKATAMAHEQVCISRSRDSVTRIFCDRK